MSHQPNNIFAGTQVVALVEVRGTNNSLVHPRGAVGVVTRTPAVPGEKFLVRFPDGFEKALDHAQLEVLKHFKDRLGDSSGAGRSDNGVSNLKSSFDLESCILYRCIVGSRAYGLDTRFSNNKVELGSEGELTPWFLYLNRERKVHQSLCLDATTTLARQVEARLADFFPGAALKLKPIEGTNLVTLLIRTSPSGNFHRPQNVGYGLTNILPILAACLAASPGQPVIIENPEAHLHPAAQAKMGQFLAQVAATGVQVILESHSDHILNGIRRAVKERILPPESVVIHYFQRIDKEGSPESQVISPVINESGVIDHWPRGFFDQFDRDLEVLTDWNHVS